jgi:pimeloyl-ACP methyl ester carboxylesterase
MAARRIPPRAVATDLRGAAKLAIDGVQGVVGIVESMHQRIAGGRPVGGSERPTSGITGLVYRSIRGTTGLVGGALDLALAGVQRTLAAAPEGGAEGLDSPARDALVAAVNGVVGDHLARTGNPLAIPMELRTRPGFEPTAHLLVMIHGLCMNDRQWLRNGIDLGQDLAPVLGATPVYARYNSGRHISLSGHDFAAALDRLVRGWPVPVTGITLVGHSMGGLVARSAARQAQEQGMTWTGLLRRMVFLGSPHHGAPLERGGNWVHRVLGVAPYMAPFTRLSGLRSEGITDLRHGNLLDADWAGERFAHRDARTPVPLPSGVDCYAIAGVVGEGLLGDGLVTVDSALGRHTRHSLNLGLPPSRQWVAQGVGHLDLMGSPAVAAKLKRWLRPPKADPASALQAGKK